MRDTGRLDVTEAYENGQTRDGIIAAPSVAVTLRDCCCLERLLGRADAVAVTIIDGGNVVCLPLLLVLSRVWRTLLGGPAHLQHGCYGLIAQVCRIIRRNSSPMKSAARTLGSPASHKGFYDVDIH